MCVCVCVCVILVYNVPILFSSETDHNAHTAMLSVLHYRVKVTRYHFVILASIKITCFTIIAVRF